MDRSLLDEAQARLPADALPLIVDEDGAVLEASRANVFAVRDGALLTPPLDGRILPGRHTHAGAGARGDLGVGGATRSSSPASDLLAADEVFLTGSVRGIERVRALDGTALPSSDEVTGRTRRRAAQAWLGAQVG